MGGEGAIALDHAIGGEDVERCERRGAGQRVAGVTVRMQEGALLRVLVIEGADRRPRS